MIIEMLQTARLPLLSDLKPSAIMHAPKSLDGLHIKFETLEAGKAYGVDDTRAQILIDIGAAKLAGVKNKYPDTNR